jgi:putative aldouronate transport system substrate-binding protein
MNLRRIVPVLLAVVLTLTLVSCAAATPTTAPTATVPADPYAEHISISTCTVDAEKAGKSAQDEYFFKKFNVSYEFWPVTWGDWKEKVRAWVAADDMPDLVWHDMKIADTGEFKTWAASGAFKAFPDLAAYPNLKALYDKMQSPQALCTVDGKLYAWPGERNGSGNVDNQAWVKGTYQGVAMYRRDWAKAVGLYKEKDIYTWDEAKALIKAVIEQDPGKNGLGQTIPLTFETWALPGTLIESLGFQDPLDPYVKGTDGKWTPVWATADYKKGVEFVVDLYRNGYIWKDQMLVKGSEGNDKFKAGQVFMHWGNANGGLITDNYDTMLKNGVIKDIDAIATMQILSPADNKSLWLTQTEDYWAITAFNHNVDDKKQARVLAMWDWLSSFEGNAFRAFGVPGTDFTVDAQKNITLLWPKNDNGDPVDPYSDAKSSKFYLRQPGWYGSWKEMGRKDTDTLLGSLMDFSLNNPNLKLHKMNWAVRSFDGENYKQFGNYNSDVQARILALCGSTEDVGVAWDAFVAEYLPKVQPVLDELNAGLK